MAEKSTINPFEELRSQELESTPELKKIRDQIGKNTDEYEIKKGDTIAGISKNYGVAYTDLIDLNVLLGKQFVFRGKTKSNILIKQGDKIKIPKNIDEFNSNLEKIKEISKVLNLNRQVLSRDTKGIKNELNGALFPRRIQSIGLPNVLDGFINAQIQSIDPRLPRIVDSSREVHVTCANLIRMLMAQSVNPGDLRLDEKKYLQKQNVDAWMLPEELLKIGFTQPHNLMGEFDKGRIGDIDPLKQDKKKDYEVKVSALGKYLETSGVKGSLVPYYFIHSSYKGRTGEYNRNREDKHYNTHQSMFAGNTRIQFYAYEIGNVVNGNVESFGDDKKKILKQIAIQENELRQSQKLFESNKAKLLSVIKPENNPSLQTKINAIEKVIKRLSNGNDELASKIRVEIESRESQRIKYNISKLIRYPISDADVEYILALEGAKNKALEGVKQIEKQLNGVKDLSEIDTSNLGRILNSNDLVNSSLISYNNIIKKISKLKIEIKEKKDFLEGKGKEQLKLQEEQKKASTKLVELNKELVTLNKELEQSKNKLLDSILLDKNSELKSKIDKYYKIIFTGKNFSSESQKQQFLNNLINSDAQDDDTKYRKNLLFSIKKVESSIAKIKQEMGLKGDNIGEINITSLGRLVNNNEIISTALIEYNKQVAKLNLLNSQIASNKELLKIEKTISVIDFIANFIQVRADIGSSYSQNLRNKIYEGLEKYPDLVNIKVDGVKVNIAEQIKLFKTTKKGLLEVKPSSKIEISGPLMIDGEHQITSSDEDRRQKMNARTRMFFEFVVPQLYLPTELLEPGKDSSFRKNKFERHQDNLKVIGVYDVRRGDTVEKVLKEQIVIFEKLDPADPKFQEKFSRFYALQIKALQLGGFLQDENTLNPGAFKINRVLPYYDSSNISKLFGEYIAQKKNILKQTNENTKELKEFINIKTFPGDVPSSIFNRVKEYVLSFEHKFIKFPNLKIIKELNEYQQYLFITQFLDQSINNNKNFNSKLFLKDIKPGKDFVLSLADVDSILKGIIGVHYYTGSPIYRKDNTIIHMVAHTEQMRNLVRTVEFIETHESLKYGEWNPRKTLKQYGEKIDMIFNNDFAEAAMKQSYNMLNSIVWMSNLGFNQLPNYRHPYVSNSISDFQVRINEFSSGWIDWITKETFQEFFRILDSKEYKNYISTLDDNQKQVVNNDLKTVQQMKDILNKGELSKHDFLHLMRLMRKILVIDDGTQSNAIGKLLGSILMRDKIANHMEKLNGMLTFSGINIEEEVYGNKEIMSDYEQSILIINHIGENPALYAFTENFLLRIFDKGFNKEIFTQDVFDKSTKGKMKGQIAYNHLTFARHMKGYFTQLEGSIKNDSDKLILDKIKNFISNFEKSGDRNKAIFDFMKDEELQKYLSNKGISRLLIPEKTEFTKSNFQKSVFDYATKKDRLVLQKNLQASK